MGHDFIQKHLRIPKVFFGGCLVQCERVGLNQRSCSTPGIVSIGTGDPSRVYHLGV